MLVYRAKWTLVVTHSEVIVVILQEKLIDFILACQDSETGGFSDRPGDWVSPLPLVTCKPPHHMHMCMYTQVDPFHTLFGLTGLSLLGNREVKPVNPVLCMPEETLQRIGLKIKLLTS